MMEKERIEALEMAIKNEVREMEFYLKHASRTDNPLGKSMFENLAKDEKEHLDKIKELHQRLKEQGRWPEDVPLEVKGTRIQEVFESAAKSSMGSGRTNMDDMEAVRIAMEFEERGAVFYAELATKCDDPREREFFLFLSSMEHHHLMSLRDTMAYFEDPEGWFVSKERHTLDGA